MLEAGYAVRGKNYSRWKAMLEAGYAVSGKKTILNERLC